MCGLAGSFGPGLLSDKQVEATFQALYHRGPDANDICRLQVQGLNVALLHTRLSIIDLEDRATQPMSFENLVIVYNGELYNYKEIRARLVSKGYSFATESDTEVLLKAWHCWGADSLDLFEGMWAFALLDKNTGRVHLCRDRFGEKPLFYMWSDGQLLFASEVKALAALSGKQLRTDRDKISKYLVNGFRSLHKDETCFFHGVQAVERASILTFAANAEPQKDLYWKLEHKHTPISMADAVDQTKALLERALQLRLRADVPIAFCLSGGIDSTSLACLAAQKYNTSLDTFSIIDRDERYNEKDNIDAVVDHLGCKAHFTHIDYGNFIPRMQQLVAAHDMPVPTISYYVHSFLSEKISQNGFKVAISGTGADELFTGYYDHYSFWLSMQADNADIGSKIDTWKTTYGRHVNNPALQDPLKFATDPDNRDHIYQNRDLFNSYLKEPVNQGFTEMSYSNELLRNRMMNELFHEIVPVILQADDSNSMHYSVENRSPFLDRQLAEFLYSVPSELLIANGLPKWLLRAAMQGILPDKVRLDTQKKGFNASIDTVVDRQDPDTRAVLLDDSPVFELVHKEALETFLNNDMKSNSFSKFLFSFISVKLFVEQYGF